MDLIESIKGHSLPPVLEARLVAALETALANSRKVGLICGRLEGFIRLVQFGADRESDPAARAAQLIDGPRRRRRSWRAGRPGHRLPTGPAGRPREDRVRPGGRRGPRPVP